MADVDLALAPGVRSLKPGDMGYDVLVELPLVTLEPGWVVWDDVAPLPPVTVTNHGRLDTDEFSEDESYDAQEALGWSDEDTDLFMFGPGREGGYAHLCDEMGPFEAERILDEALEEEESRYRRLVEEAIELRERERERGQWRFDDDFQPAVGSAAVASQCKWDRSSGSRRGSYRGVRRRVVRTSQGPPDQPRPSSGDDDPDHDDVALARVVAA